MTTWGGLTRRRATWSPTVLTPIVLPEGLLVMRSPRLSDGPAWSAARLANREWLERAFPAWSDDWETEQSEVAWAQRWWQLRRLALAGLAKPFVIFLDGELVGESGVDAIDVVSGAGEVSNWKVSNWKGEARLPASVMSVASLLLLEHAFVDQEPIARMVAPIATTSRRGRSPAVQALGFEIEAVVPRLVGSKGLVDHDVWVLHNTAASRASVTEMLRPLRAVEPPHTSPGTSRAAPRGVVARSAGRAALREVRGGVHRARAKVTDRRAEVAPRLCVSAGNRSVTLRSIAGDEDTTGGALPRDTTRCAVETDGRLHAVIGHRDDHGTGTTEVFVVPEPAADRDVVATAVETILTDLRPHADEPRVLVVRIPESAPRGNPVDDDLMSALGLERLATYRGHPDGLNDWGGEDVWRMPASS